METIKHNPGIKIHLRMAISYCVLAGIIQGFTEGFILSILYNGYIFRPQDLFESHIFVVISKILHVQENSSVPLILDRYLGPSFMDKLQVIVNLMTVYAVAGLVVGVFLGALIWSALRFWKKRLDLERLNLLYLSVIITFCIFANLTILLDGRYRVATFSIIRLTMNASLIANAVFFTYIVYKLLCTLWSSESKKAFLTELSKLQGRIALLSIALISFTALILNIWVFEKERASSVFNHEKKHNSQLKPYYPRKSNINVILISVDTLRADHLGCYGYLRETSPNIDKLAKEGIIFSEAFSVTSWTLPAHASMFTSMYPDAHGLITAENRLDENELTLAEILREHGYMTTAFVSAPVLNSIFGLDQGFDFYDDFSYNLDPDKPVSQLVTSPMLNQVIQTWIKKNHKKKFFLFLHYFDVHDNYIPPPPYDTMFDPDYDGSIDGADFVDVSRVNHEMDPRDLHHMIALYDGEIAFTDNIIGKLFSTLKELGIWDDTLIILTSDHGEEFFEHGNKGHSKTLYDEVLHVPLIIKFPDGFNLERNRKVADIASIIDIMPTILDFLSIRAPQAIQGRSLMPLLNVDKESHESFIYASLLDRLAAVRSPSSKFVGHLKKRNLEFYDLVNDPEEKTNLLDNTVSETDARVRKHQIELLQWLNAHRQRYREFPKTSAADKKLSNSVKEQLKTLGYIQ